LLSTSAPVFPSAKNAAKFRVGGVVMDRLTDRAEWSR
jgi:hypothetical protein